MPSKPSTSFCNESLPFALHGGTYQRQRIFRVRKALIYWCRLLLHRSYISWLRRASTLLGSRSICQPCRQHETLPLQDEDADWKKPNLKHSRSSPPSKLSLTLRCSFSGSPRQQRQFMQALLVQGFLNLPSPCGLRP